MFYFSINEKAMETIKKEASATDKEIIGILIGRVYDNLLVVTDVVSGDQISGSTRVKLDNETLAKIVDKIMKGEIDGNILGWYHSHPGFGVFMSATDIATQQMLQQFSSKVAALVIDPKEDAYEVFTLDRKNGVTQLAKEQIYTYPDGEDGIPRPLRDAHRFEAELEITPPGSIDRIRYVIEGTASLWLEKICPVCGSELKQASRGQKWYCPALDSAGLKETGSGIKKVEVEPKPKKHGQKCKNCGGALRFSRKLGAFYCRKCRRVYKRRVKSTGDDVDEKDQGGAEVTEGREAEAVATLEVDNDTAVDEASTNDTDDNNEDY